MARTLRLGLSFEAAAPPEPIVGRTDVAVFVGAVHRRRDASGRPIPLPPAALRDLAAMGLDDGDGELVDHPVAVETFEAFRELFAPVARRASERDPENLALASPLAAAVRAFFGAGGARAWIVRTGDPPPVLADRRERYRALARALPGATAAEAFPEQLVAQLVLARGPVSSEPGDWRGLELLYALPEASFALLPDLADLLATPPPAVAPSEAVTASGERFIECAVPAVRAEPEAGRRLAPPRLDATGLAAWRRLLALARLTLDNGGRSWNRADVQLLASVPLGGEDAAPAALLAELTGGTAAPTSDRIALAFPWLRTAVSGDCPGGVEAPEGSLAGVLARSALERGSYRSAARRPLPRVVDFQPDLDPEPALEATHDTPLGEMSLGDRVCLILPSPRGPELATDVTLAPDRSLRPGSVRRLLNLLAAEGRRIGEDVVFLPSGEALWGRLRARFADLGRRLAAAGALAATDESAFQVRCDRTTTTQADLDAGRVVVEIAVVPAQPVRRIRVVLALDVGGAPLVEAA